MVFTKAMIISMIISYSQMLGVDHKVALAVAKVESQYNPKAISKDKEDVGVFQLRAKYYPQYSKKELFNPHTNVILGLLTLKQMRKECPHKLNKSWTICYNRGVAGAKKVKFPEKDKYVRQIKLAMED
jgi:hypothetical protein